MKTVSRALALALLLAPVLGGAQSLQTYLQARKEHGVTGPAAVGALDDLVGSKVLEIQGTVKGVVGSGDSELLLVLTPSGIEYYVQSAGAPDWLKTGTVQARMLLKAERDGEATMLRARLLHAVSESDIAGYEARNRPVKAAASRPMKSLTSRKGGRPAPMPGSIPKALTTNPIGQPKPNVSDELARALPAYTSFVQSRNPELSAADSQRIAECILGYSAHFGVDARLIVAIVLAESDFRPGSTSRAGAIGLGQLMPASAKALKLTDAYDVQQNLYGTVRIVRGQIDRYSKQTDDSFEALVLALAGYNAGNGAVKKHGGVPPYRETQNYVRKVIGYYSQLCGR